MYMTSFLTERENRFDQIRLGLALLVVLGHCWHISTGPDAQVPLQDFLRRGFHEYALNMFFFISGLLVTQSAFRRQGDLFGFALARVMRIFPGLIVCALAVPLFLIVAGAWIDPTLQQVVNYAGRLVSLVFVEFSRPNVFVGLPFEHAINGSVWSLRHEVGAYALLALFVASGAFFTRRWVLLAYCCTVLVIAIIGHVVAPKGMGGIWFLLAETRVVIVSFLLGVLTHRFAAWLWIDWRIAALLWGVTFAGQSMLPDVAAVYWFNIVLSYTVLCLAYLGGRSKGLPLDLSYGVYIYGWPLQQLAVMFCLQHFAFVPGPMTLFLLVLPALLIVAWASWVFVERPAISLGQRRGSARWSKLRRNIAV